MNGFDFIKRGELDIIKSSLRNRKEQLTAKVLAGDFKNLKDKESIQKSLSIIADILSAVDDTIQTIDTRNKVEKSNYKKIPLDILHNLEIQLRARKEYIDYRVSKNDFSCVHEEHSFRREGHKVNLVHDLVRGAYTNVSKQDSAKKHVGETGLASDGKTVITIDKWVNSNNITVSFPNGKKLEHQTYSKFKKGYIETSEDYISRKQLEKRILKGTVTPVTGKNKYGASLAINVGK